MIDWVIDVWVFNVDFFDEVLEVDNLDYVGFYYVVMCVEFLLD